MNELEKSALFKYGDIVFTPINDRDRKTHWFLLFFLKYHPSTDDQDIICDNLEDFLKSNIMNVSSYVFQMERQHSTNIHYLSITFSLKSAQSVSNKLKLFFRKDIKSFDPLGYEGELGLYFIDATIKKIDQVRSFCCKNGNKINKTFYFGIEPVEFEQKYRHSWNEDSYQELFQNPVCLEVVEKKKNRIEENRKNKAISKLINETNEIEEEIKSLREIEQQIKRESETLAEEIEEAESCNDRAAVKKLKIKERSKLQKEATLDKKIIEKNNSLEEKERIKRGLGGKVPDDENLLEKSKEILSISLPEDHIKEKSYSHTNSILLSKGETEESYRKDCYISCLLDTVTQLQAENNYLRKCLEERSRLPLPKKKVIKIVFS